MLFCCGNPLHNDPMKYGYARVSTDGQSVEAQVGQLTKAGCKKVFREVASGAKTDRAQLRRLLALLNAGDVVTVTRLDRLARSTPRPVEHPRGDYRQEGRVPIHGRRMGGHDDLAWAADVDRAGRSSGV
jgi:predicted site-specific integrase-resolvase